MRTLIILGILGIGFQPGMLSQDHTSRDNRDVPTDGTIEMTLITAADLSSGVNSGVNAPRSQTGPTEKGCILVGLKNVAPALVEIWITVPSRDFAFEVFDESNRPVPLTELGKKLPRTPEDRHQWAGRRILKTLALGEAYQARLCLQSYYHMRPDHNYTVRVRRLVTKQEIDGKLTSSTLQVSSKIRVPPAIQ